MILLSEKDFKLVDGKLVLKRKYRKFKREIIIQDL